MPPAYRVIASLDQARADATLKKKITAASTCRDLHIHCSFPLFARYRTATTVSQATFTPSIQLNLGLPSAHLPLTYGIDTPLAIWYCSILSMRPNHLSTPESPEFWAPTPTRLHSHLFIANPVHSLHSYRTFLKHIHFLSALPIYRHFVAFGSNPTAQHTRQCCP